MPTRSTKKRPRDLNKLAASIVADTTGDAPPAADDGKNPAAVALGRLGGQKAGKARAAKLSAKRRSEIAKQAAAKRWDTRRELASAVFEWIDAWYNPRRRNTSIGDLSPVQYERRHATAGDAA